MRMVLLCRGWNSGTNQALADAWRREGMPPLEIAGDGPQRGLLEGIPGITLHGAVTAEVVRARMASAAVLVMPTLWYEGMPLVVLEAFAAALPGVGSDIGARPELIQHGRNGWLTPPGDVAALVGTVQHAFRVPDLTLRSADALSTYLTRYTPERAIESLLDVYRAAGAP